MPPEAPSSGDSPRSIRIGNDPSIMLLEATSNPLLDSLSARLTAEGLHVVRVAAVPTSGKGRFATWRSSLTTAACGAWHAIRFRRGSVAFHFLHPSSVIIAALFGVMGRPFAIHLWGSDFVYWRRRNNWLLRFVLRRARFVSLANTQMLEEARTLWGKHVRFRTLRFGLDAIDDLRATPSASDTRTRPDTLQVVMGTNSQVAQQHEDMIQAIESLPEATKRRCNFVFPLSYGDRNNRERVLARLKQASFQHSVLDRMIFGSQLANFRRSTDVLVQIQTHDALSGAMLESLYAGARVITGRWLPYDDLRSQGIDWIEIGRTAELVTALQTALDLSIDVGHNRRIVAQLADWQQVLPTWVAAYADLSQ
jgi:hypothetical protein